MGAVYFVGPQYQHHASHSGYQGFCAYLGTHVTSPVRARYFEGRHGWKLDTWITRRTSRSYYSLGILLIEMAAGLHMASHRRAIYHAIYGDTDIWLLPKLRRLTNHQLIASFHEPPSNLAYMRVDRKLINHLDAVILVSSSQRSYFEEMYPTDRIFVVPHGIDTKHYRPGPRLGQDVCITVGSHYRDFGLLKTAMDLVWQRRPGARLMAIGTRRENDPNPRFDTDDPRIRFIDGIPDGELVQAYQGARVALCPLAQATATNAMLEAMACGLPIVATDVGGVREYLGTGVGLVSAPARPEEFAANILRVLEDESEALEMSRRSRARALQLDFAVVARAMKGVYDQIESWPSRSQRQLSR